MDENINIFKNFEDLNNLKLPLLKQNKIINHVNNNIDELNKNIILLEKVVNNNNKLIEKNDNKEKEIIKNRNSNIRKKSFLYSHYNMFNSSRKSKNKSKLQLITVIKNPLKKVKSSKDIVNNNFFFKSSKIIPPIMSFNKKNFSKPSLKNFNYSNRNIFDSNKNTPRIRNENIQKKVFFPNILNKIHLSAETSFNDDLLDLNTKTELNNNLSISPDKVFSNDNFLFNSSKKNNNNFNIDNFHNIIKNINLTSEKFLSMEINENENDNNASTIRSKKEEEEKYKIYNILKSKKKDKNITIILINLIKKLRKNNLKIYNNLHYCKSKFDELNFNLVTKLKYSKWKYEISDYDKYFIDIDNFGERERKEIDRKKTFYDFLEDAVDSISERKYMKKYSLSNDKEKNNININDFKKIKMLNDKDFPNSELTILKQKEIQNSLEKITKRKIKEKKKRSQIKNLLQDSFREAKAALKI